MERLDVRGILSDKSIICLLKESRDLIEARQNLKTAGFFHINDEKLEEVRRKYLNPQHSPKDHDLSLQELDEVSGGVKLMPKHENTEHVLIDNVVNDGSELRSEFDRLEINVTDYAPQELEGTFNLLNEQFGMSLRQENWDTMSEEERSLVVCTYEARKLMETEQYELNFNCGSNHEKLAAELGLFKTSQMFPDKPIETDMDSNALRWELHKQAANARDYNGLDIRCESGKVLADALLQNKNISIDKIEEVMEIIGNEIVNEKEKVKIEVYKAIDDRMDSFKRVSYKKEVQPDYDNIKRAQKAPFAGIVSEIDSTEHRFVIGLERVKDIKTARKLMVSCWGDYMTAEEKSQLDKGEMDNVIMSHLNLDNYSEIIHNYKLTAISGFMDGRYSSTCKLFGFGDEERKNLNEQITKEVCKNASEKMHDDIGIDIDIDIREKTKQLVSDVLVKFDDTAIKRAKRSVSKDKVNSFSDFFKLFQSKVETKVGGSLDIGKGAQVTIFPNGGYHINLCKVLDDIGMGEVEQRNDFIDWLIGDSEIASTYYGQLLVREAIMLKLAYSPSIKYTELSESIWTSNTWRKMYSQKTGISYSSWFDGDIFNELTNRHPELFPLDLLSGVEVGLNFHMSIMVFEYFCEGFGFIGNKEKQEEVLEKYFEYFSNKYAASLTTCNISEIINISDSLYKGFGNVDNKEKQEEVLEKLFECFLNKYAASPTTCNISEMREMSDYLCERFRDVGNKERQEEVIEKSFECFLNKYAASPTTCNISEMREISDYLCERFKKVGDQEKQKEVLEKSFEYFLKKCAFYRTMSGVSVEEMREMSDYLCKGFGEIGDRKKEEAVDICFWEMYGQRLGEKKKDLRFWESYGQRLGIIKKNDE